MGLEPIGGVVTGANLLLGAVIGVRLLRLARTSGGPEKWLGLHLLLYTVAATMVSATLYMGWSDPSLAMPDGLARSMNALFFALQTLGVPFLAIFTQQTFRPGKRGARIAVYTLSALIALGAIGIGVGQGFEVRVQNTPGYWVVFWARTAVYAWVTAESFLYFARMRKRLRLGLAEPLVVNRFLLWGIWGGVVLVMSFSDPVARVWYASLAGSNTEWIPSVGRPIILTMIAATSALGTVAGSALFLTFFPPAAYKRWIGARGLAGQSPR